MTDDKIIAKNLKYTRLFGKLFKSQKLKKTYLAICDGMPKLKESYVDLNIKNNSDKVIKTQTFYKILSYNNKTSLIKLFKCPLKTFEYSFNS